MTATKAPTSKPKTVSFKGLNSQLQLTLTQLIEQLIQTKEVEWQVVTKSPADLMFIDPEVYTQIQGSQEIGQDCRVITISEKRKTDTRQPHLSCPIKAREFINCFQHKD